MKKRIIHRNIVPLLIGTILLSTFSACADVHEPSETTDSTQSAYETEAGTELRDNLPDDLYYQGEEIVFISFNEMTYEDLSGDIVEDAVFERNKMVEDRLGVKIECIQDGNAIDKVVIAVNGGSAEYDVMIDPCWRTAPKFVGNFFRNLRETKYLDFDKIWWNQSFNHEVLYKDAQYGITGAMVLSLYRRTFVTVFNKDIFTEANQPFLYEYVDNGTWTLDKQTAMVPLFHQDNGNNKQDQTGDIYGFISNDFIHVDPYWTSFEIDIIKKNSDGEYEWVFDPAEVHDMAEKVLALYNGTGNASYIERDDPLAERTVWDMFAGGYGAMATVCIAALEDPAFRNMTQEYGVVPIPRYSESQDRYYSQIHYGFDVICMPTTVTDDRADMLSAVLEAMSATSYRIVRPVYYETTLRTKLAKDPQSAEMMDLIIDNIRIDAGFVYTHTLGNMSQGFHQGFQQLMASGQNDAVSRYKRSSVAAQKALSRLVDQLDGLSQ